MILLVGLWGWLWVGDRVLFVKVCIFHNQKMHFYLIIFYEISMLAGVWLSAFSLGNFVGPTLAGFLVQTEGFRRTTTIFFGLYVVMMAVDLFEIVLMSSKRRRMAQEYESLN